MSVKFSTFAGPKPSYESIKAGKTLSQSFTYKVQIAQIHWILQINRRKTKMSVNPPHKTAASAPEGACRAGCPQRQASHPAEPPHGGPPAAPTEKEPAFRRIGSFDKTYAILPVSRLPRNPDNTGKLLPSFHTWDRLCDPAGRSFPPGTLTDTRCISQLPGS